MIDNNILVSKCLSDRVQSLKHVGVFTGNQVFIKTSNLVERASPYHLKLARRLTYMDQVVLDAMDDIEYRVHYPIREGLVAWCDPK
jgi:hypothetical protein